ncbi:hypothetical protein DFA_04507 [Cavenderia fasciculata]|uniref:Transmembrane protein n=1 Tax=Cavenderia fasciculata TaxID=261658 RepID=F4PPS6_CACFS|nr:uncharacterized protein DFA_04507 [Cavenderia fasciculata]EGG22389.1 hypothetical protein DFA_04507 [Cavenderia fasciculata]|eukprot:XP_004360240.1 hypothetical protein DFA_04507 [Cavenderia fasciculata]
MSAIESEITTPVQTLDAIENQMGYTNNMETPLKDQQKGIAVAKGGLAAVAVAGAVLSASPLFPFGYSLLLLSGVGGVVMSVVDFINK